MRGCKLRFVWLARRRFLALTGGGTVALASAAPDGCGTPARWKARCAGSARAARSRCSTTTLLGGAEYGYFGDLETRSSRAIEATATIKLVDQGQADMGFPSPGVFSLRPRAGHPAGLGRMGAPTTYCSFAFRKGDEAGQ
jgi:NitT/TauT family transport system substrate-binding protein